MLVTWAWLLACQGGDGPGGHVGTDTSTPPPGVPVHPSIGTVPAVPRVPTIGETWRDCLPDVVVPGDGFTDPPPADPDQAVAGTDPIPAFEHLGWPSWDPSTSVSFVWRTDIGTLDSEVRWGTGALDQLAVGASYVIGADVLPPGVRIHEVRLCGALLAGRDYQYQVGGPDGWSPTHAFRSAPVPGSTDPFRFAFLGDSRGPPEIFGQLLAMVDADDPDVVLFGGDAVSSGSNLLLWDGWWTAAGDLFARRPLVLAHGNHESLEQSYFAQFSLPGNEQWYGVRYGDVTLVVLNDTVVDIGSLAGEEVDLMNAAFGAFPGDFKLVMHHQDEYASDSTHGSNLLLRSTWSPVYESLGVELVLQSHNHAYERSVPILADTAVADGAGPVYIVSGGAGAPLYKKFDDEWFTAVKTAVYHYVIADVYPDRIDATVRDIAGNVIDTFSIPR